jgi:hypothetical protein
MPVILPPECFLKSRFTIPEVNIIGDTALGK